MFITIFMKICKMKGSWDRRFGYQRTCLGHVFRNVNSADVRQLCIPTINDKIIKKIIFLKCNKQMLNTGKKRLEEI